MTAYTTAELSGHVKELTSQIDAQMEIVREASKQIQTLQAERRQYQTEILNRDEQQP